MFGVYVDLIDTFVTRVEKTRNYGIESAFGDIVTARTQTLMLAESVKWSWKA